MAGTFEVKDFQKEVIDHSNQQPVLVDFWAPWCGPCQMLDPILKEMVAENQDRWKLAKVNTDENQALAREYGIQGIPAIRVFYKGSIIAEYNGLMYKKDFQRWLEGYLPSPSKDMLADIKSRIEEGNLTEVKEDLEKLVETDPALVEARVLLAIELILENPEKAAALVHDIHQDSEYFAEADAIRVIAYLEELKKDPSKLEESASKKELLNAIRSIEKRKLDEALETLIDIIVHNKNYHDQVARKATVALFTILGNDHDITRQYRRRFDMALY